MTIRPLQRFMIFLALVGVFVSSALYLKSYFRARSVFAEAESLLKQQYIRASIRSYARCIRWYTPGSPYTHSAIHRILRLAQHALDQGDWEMALFAHQRLYNALSSIRSFYQPYAEMTRLCREQLASLLALLPSATMTPPSEIPLLHQHLQEILARDEGPSRPLSVLALFFFVAYLASITVSLWQWPLLRRRQRWLLGVLASSSLAFWLLFLYLA